MKVSTDACLFGAWLAWKMQAVLPPAAKALDIGTGTGLLSLMLAQELDLTIDAVELEEQASRQARLNVLESPWPQRITVYPADIRVFLQHAQPLYNLILSNPPFFRNDLRSAAIERELARHESTLDLRELFHLAVSALAVDGYFALLLPAHRLGEALEYGFSEGIHARCITAVRHTYSHAVQRIFILFTRQPGDLLREEICIKDGSGYTPAFTRLLQPYYLYL